MLIEPVFVEMTAEEEQRAIEARADLLTPLFLNEHGRRTEDDD